MVLLEVCALLLQLPQRPLPSGSTLGSVPCPAVPPTMQARSRAAQSLWQLYVQQRGHSIGASLPSSTSLWDVVNRSRLEMHGPEAVRDIWMEVRRGAACSECRRQVGASCHIISSLIFRLHTAGQQPVVALVVTYSRPGYWPHL